MKKKPKYNQNVVIRGALRRAFARSPLVQEKMAESRREVPRYNKDGSRAKKNAVQRQCEVCSNWVGSTKIAVDHIDPVVSVEDGFQDWNVFVDRLWCAKENLQRICDDCHNKKTAKERFDRMFKKEQALIAEIINIDQPGFESYIKNALKKFTPKRLSDPKYPTDFVASVRKLRTNYKMKV